MLKNHKPIKSSALGKNKTHNKGFDNASMKDFNGYIAECTAANIFFVIKAEIHMPDPYCFLDGITRQTVIEIAKQNGYVRHIRLEELESVDEVFVTGTAAEITPVRIIEDKVYKVGPITKDIKDAYTKLVTRK